MGDLSFFQLTEKYPDEESAVDYFTSKRWPYGAVCVRCGSKQVYDSNADARSAGWNPFHAIKHGLEDVEHAAFKTIETPWNLTVKAYDKVTPKDLRSVLRWTPYGLVFRTGVKLERETKAHLATMVKWSPGGIMFRGIEYPLEHAVLPAQ